MIRRYQRLFNTASVLLEILIFAVSYLAATYIRFSLMKGAVETVDQVWTQYYISAALLYGGVIVLLYACAGLYGSMRTKRFRYEAARAVLLNLVGIVLMTAFLYFTRVSDFSRISITLFFVISTLLILTKRAAVRRVLRHYRRKGFNLRHVVVVGCGRLAEQYARSVAAHPEWGYRIAGFITAQEGGAANGDGSALEPHLGVYADAERLLHEDANNPDEVVIALEAGEVGHMRGILDACEKQGVMASIIPYYNEYISRRATIETLGGNSVLRIHSSPLDGPYSAALKRLMDVVGSLILIALSSPLMLVAAVGTKASSPGPVIFRQERMGRNRRVFTMYKFRSMRESAERDTAWTTDDDPRKTRFGSFLRKTSIDELPQFVNVLKGDMSLVGPRPEIPHHIGHFREEIPRYMIRHRVRPGITGWAQVNGLRGDTSIEDRIEYDVWYIENWSPGLDFAILARTAFGGTVNRERMV